MYAIRSYYENDCFLTVYRPISGSLLSKTSWLCLLDNTCICFHLFYYSVEHIGYQFRGNPVHPPVDPVFPRRYDDPPVFPHTSHYPLNTVIRGLKFHVSFHTDVFFSSQIICDHDTLFLYIGRITSYNVCYTKLLRHMYKNVQGKNPENFVLAGRS